MLNNLDDDDNDKQTQEQFMSLLMEMTESLSFANTQLMCYTCGISQTNMTSYILSDNNYNLNQVLMVMPDQVWMQPNLRNESIHWNLTIHL